MDGRVGRSPYVYCLALLERGGPTTASRHIGVCLSGGGHRASLFGLGALIYLVDAGKGPEISCISSVSGGSITNGWVGLKTDLFVAAPGDFRSDVAPLAAAVSTRGTLWSAPLTYLYLVFVASVLLGTTVLGVSLDGAWRFVVGGLGLVIAGWLARQRGWIAAKALDRALFEGATLSRLNPNTDHVICACDLRTTENVYFSGRFVYSYPLGWGVPGNLPLTRAIQASASLPGAFAPAALPTGRHLFPLAGAGAKPVTRMILTDGGVYDNMSTEWPLFLATRVRLGAAPEPPPHPVDDVVFVNSSPGMSAKPRRSLTMPLLGEITSLLAAKDILYEQTIVPRRRMIVSYLRAAEAGFGGLAGCMVQVDFSPYDLPRAFASGSDDRAQRAKAALALLTAGEEAAWKADSEANSKVRTALSKIPAERAARLMRHSYVLTMVNMHVTRDYPLLPIPSVADFEKLVV